MSRKTSCNEHKQCNKCGAELKTARITNIFGHPCSGLWQVHFDNGEVVHLESGYGARALVDAFGTLENAIGKRIQYSTDFLGVIEGFVPLDIGG